MIKVVICRGNTLTFQVLKRYMPSKSVMMLTDTCETRKYFAIVYNVVLPPDDCWYKDGIYGPPSRTMIHKVYKYLKMKKESYEKDALRLIYNFLLKLVFTFKKNSIKINPIKKSIYHSFSKKSKTSIMGRTVSSFKQKRVNQWILLYTNKSDCSYCKWWWNNRKTLSTLYVSILIQSLFTDIRTWK